MHSKEKIIGNEHLDLETSEYIVAFIDILGASEMIRNDENTSLFFIYNILSLAEKEIREFSKKRNNCNDVTIKTFSDNIVISCKICNSNEEKNIVESLLPVLIASVGIQNSFLMERILVRGGVTKGTFKGINFGLNKASSIVWGKALLRAYDLESNVAIYPRIVVDPILIELLGGEEKYGDFFVDSWRFQLKNLIKKDIDNIFFLNHLNCIFKNKIGMKILEDAYAFSNEKLSEYHSNISEKNTHAIRLTQKLSWSVRYLKEAIDCYGANENGKNKIQ